MSMIAKVVTGSLFVLIAAPAIAQSTTTNAPSPSPAPTTPPAPAQYPAQPVAQSYPQQQPVAQTNPQQPGAQPYPPQQQYPQQPGAQPYPQQQYPQQPGAQPYPPQQQYPQQPGAQPYPQQAGMQLQPEPVSPAVARTPQIKSVSFGGKIGAQLTGSGTREVECSGACGTTGTESKDGDVSAAAAIGLDLLIKIGEFVRVGPSLVYTHTMDQTPDGAASREYGSLTTLDAVAEAIPRVAPTVWIVPRVKTGLIMYHASGESKDSETTSKNACTNPASTTITYSGCDSLKSPHIGYNLGGSLGVMFAVGDVLRIRFDTLAEYFSYRIGKISVSDANESATLTANTSGTRFLLLGGVEL